MHSFEIDGHRALGFDTGLNARAFAQAKLAQFITEPGLIVRPSETPPNRVGFWKASGVREIIGADGPSMVVWGPPVEGERLDTLLEAPCNGSGQQDKALAAVSLWIQAILALGENPYGEHSPGKNPRIPLWPCAALIRQGDEGRPPEVFFAPPSLTRRSVIINDEWYVNADLDGMAAAAFTAAAMLYRIFSGTPPFSAADISILHQDMRDNNFLPVHLAVPGLEPRLASLIQAALERPAPEQHAAAGLSELLEAIQAGGKTVSAASLVKPLAEPDRLLLEKEKDQFLKVNTVSVKTRRFVARNTALLMGCLASVVAAAFIVYSIIDARARMPSTAGMDPLQVIECYYRAFGDMDHQMMEACVTDGAGKDDITAVINLFVVTKTRQAYESNTRIPVFPAHEWQGGDSPGSPLFGATDLRIVWLGGDTDSDRIRCRIDYTFWIPAAAAGEAVSETETSGDLLSLSYPRRDFVTLVRKKGNWHIAEIIRE